MLGMVPYFVQTVVQPEFMTMKDDSFDCDKSPASFENGMWQGKASEPASGSFDWRCKSPNVTAAFYAITLVSAIVFHFLWLILAKYKKEGALGWFARTVKWCGGDVIRMGKISAWIRWSTSSAVVLFILAIFPFPLPIFEALCSSWRGGKIWWLFVLAVLQGIPLGAQWLGSAILSDVCDVDEFLTGTRREAAYFQFKTWIHKAVVIPALFVPVTLLTTAGYKEPEGGQAGLPQKQELGVNLYVRGVILCGVVFSLVARWIKLSYPLRRTKTEKSVQDRETNVMYWIYMGIKVHEEGEASKNPIDEMEENKPKEPLRSENRKYYKPPTFASGDEWDVFQILEHFSEDDILTCPFFKFEHEHAGKSMVSTMKHELHELEEHAEKHGEDPLTKLKNVVTSFTSLTGHEKDMAKKREEWQTMLKDGAEDLRGKAWKQYEMSMLIVFFLGFLTFFFTFEEALPKLTGVDFLNHKSPMFIWTMIFLGALGGSFLYCAICRLRYIASKQLILKVKGVIIKKKPEDKNPKVEALAFRKIVDHIKAMHEEKTEKKHPHHNKYAEGLWKYATLLGFYDGKIAPAGGDPHAHDHH